MKFFEEKSAQAKTSLLRSLGITEKDMSSIVSRYGTIGELEDRAMKILEVIRAIEKSNGILEMPRQSRYAILKTYLKNKNREISAETIVPRPLIDNTIDESLAGKWLQAQPARLRDLFEFLKNEVIRVNQEDFEYELERTMESFINLTGGRPYIIVEFRYQPKPGYPAGDVKSADWCYDLIREKGYPTADKVVLMNFTQEAVENLKRIMRDTGIRDLVFLDDASYSGNQCIGTLLQVLGNKLNNEEGEDAEVSYTLAEEFEEDVNLHLLIPFVTTRTIKRAEQELNGYQKRTGRRNVNVKIHSHRRIKSIKEIFKESIAQASSVKEKKKIIELYMIFNKEFPKFYRNLTLTYFQHKLVDYMCMPREFIYGSIVHPQEYFVPDIPFIPPVFKAPYSKGYFSMLRELLSFI